MQYKILLYYLYTNIKDPNDLLTRQKELCNNLNLLGRILISKEGINGTVCGDLENIDKYMIETKKYDGLKDIEFKVSFDDYQVFNKIKITLRDEIVTLGIKKTGKDVSIKNKAKYIKPIELKNLYNSNEKFYIIDARNNYEAKIGKFKNAITFDVKNFRDIPNEINKISHLRKEKVVTYCTGGVRCEKFSALLKESGFENVKQLHGGIHEYGVQAGGENFEGTMYVFDKRIHTEVNKVNPTIISNCYYCNKKVARYINCTNQSCSKKMIACESCDKEHEGYCSEKCKEVVVLMKKDAETSSA